MELACLPSRQQIVVQRLGASAPLRWLKLGWRDLRRAPADAMLYGAAFVLMAYLLVFFLADAPQLAVALCFAFVLIGPFLAIGLYDIARQLEAFNGGRVMLAHSALAWRVNGGAIALYGVLLGLLVCGWVAASLLLFALFYQGQAPSLGALLTGMLGSENWLFLGLWAGLALLFAVLAFALSVCTPPILLDKEIDAMTAMQASLLVVGRNGVTMTVWAAMILTLTALGFASQFVGLLLVTPLLGLASWHAYRALISYQC
jgi:uncharacterized membrane protein